MPVATEDYVAISDHLARYCWAVDEGDEDGYAALFTEDAAFAGLRPEPIAGHAALRSIPRNNMRAEGKNRHLIANLACDYAGADRNTIDARYYNHVTNWADGGKNFCMALCKTTFVRAGDGWLIKLVDYSMLT